MLHIREDRKSMKLATHGSLYNRLVEWATGQPDAHYLVEAETGRTLTYAQTLAAVNAMRSLLGPSPRCIAMTLPGGIISAVTWLSVLSGGHRLHPLSPKATDEEKARIARNNAVDLLIVEHEEDALGFATPTAATIITRQICETLIQRASSLLPLKPIEGSVCLTTSGTTGEPKGVILHERQIAWTAEHVRSSHQLTTQDRGLTVLPFYHVNAPVVSLCASLLAGSTVIIAQRFSRRHFWSWIERYHITWASIVPTIVAILLETDKPSFLPSTLRFVRTGSASLPVADLLAFEAKFGIPAIETYGLSEAASQIVANPVPPGIHKPGSAGRPIGIELRICSPRSEEQGEDLCDVAPGKTGEICVAGPCMIESYQNNSGAAAFQDGWFRTGDLGYMDEDGYLFIKGRLREVINRGGENIAPREVEEALIQHPAIHEVAVVGRPDHIYGEVVVAYIVTQTPWHEEMVQDFQHYARQRLSPHKVPVDFIAIDALPRTPTGKIERRLLRAREQAHVTAKAGKRTEVSE